MTEHFKKLYDFMLKSPELSTTLEILLYAVIYSYPGHLFKGRQDVLAKWCKIKQTKTVRKALQSLEDKGLISVEKMGGEFNAFRKYRILRKPVMYSHEDYVENEYWISINEEMDR